jgi:hypothetical protein
VRHAQQGTERVEAEEAQIDLRVRSVFRRRQDRIQEREPGEEGPHRGAADERDGGAALGQNAEEARAEKRVAQTLLGKHHDPASIERIARPQLPLANGRETFAQRQRLLAPERNVLTRLMIGEALFPQSLAQLGEAQFEARRLAAQEILVGGRGDIGSRAGCALAPFAA